MLGLDRDTVVPIEHVFSPPGDVTTARARVFDVVDGVLTARTPRIVACFVTVGACPYSFAPNLEKKLMLPHPAPVRCWTP